MKKNTTPKLKKVAGWATPPRSDYKTEAGWLKGIYAVNKHNFDSYKDFKARAGKDILFETHTRRVGRYGLVVPKGKMDKNEYLEKVFAYNKEKIMKAYTSFSGRQLPNEETVFKRFKQEYNLREQYIYGRTKRNLANRSEILNALQRSDFFNTTEQRQRYSLLEEMKLTKTGKRRTMLSDFMRDTGYHSVDQMVEEQDIKNYYSMEKIDMGKKRTYRTTYLFRGREGSLWEVVIENSPTRISYKKVGDSQI